MAKRYENSFKKYAENLVKSKKSSTFAAVFASKNRVPTPYIYYI